MSKLNQLRQDQFWPHALTRFVICAAAAIELASTSFGEEQKSQKIAVEQVPAAILKVANEAEQKVDWTEAKLEVNQEGNSQSRSYVLKGVIVIRPERQKVLSDGDIEIIPGESETVEVGIFEDGKLDYVVKSLALANVPEHVMAALKRKTDLEPSYAYIARTEAKGAPQAYLIWIDTKGLLAYAVSPDGKKVERY